MDAGVFVHIAHDLREVARVAQGRDEPPSAMILDARVMQSIPESGGRAGYNGGKRKKSSKVHVAADTLGLLMAMKVTPADKQERTQVSGLCAAVQVATG